jgi:alpha-beta hydrolase superfamily lysophospholipase
MPRHNCAWHDQRVRRSRIVNAALPTEIATHDGLAYSLWLPEAPTKPRGGVVILHGAGSCKERHHDFARILLAARIGVVAFDQRGHGASAGRMHEHVLEDIAAMATLLRNAIGDPAAPIALRGSSMGGYLAILAAQPVGACAVVAICPASAEGLRRGLAAGAFDFDADAASLERFLTSHELQPAVEALTAPLLLLHAEGDEQVPVEHSRELAEHMTGPGSRLIAVPGGHHRSIQHDPDMQAISLRFLERALEAAPAR